MEILGSKYQHKFLAFLPEIKSGLHEWLFVTVKIIDIPDDKFTIQQAADLLNNLYSSKTGRIYICNSHELIILVKEDQDVLPQEMGKQIEAKLPKGRCEVNAEKPSAENLKRFQLSIKLGKPENLSEFALKRLGRPENVILVADDDMYMRTLIRKGINPRYTLYEVIHGSEIVATYKKYVPDVLFLDIHMPGKDGLENLQAILALDPQAYVVMVSSDSSSENVVWTTKHGAKGFMAKPFGKDRLVEYVEKCPTIT